MSKLWIDTLGNKQRRRLMLALRMGPSIAAIAVGGNLTTLAVAAGMFGLLGAAGKFADTRICSKITDKEVLSGMFGAVVTEDSGQLRQMGRDLAGRFGISRPVDVFVADGSAKFSVPAATIGHSVGFHPKVKENWTLKELEFVMAHEIAHIKAGDCTRARLATSMIERGTLCVAMAALAPIFAQASFPFMVAGIGIGSAGLVAARSLVKNYESRNIERRRDVEALQKTGDLQSALSVMRKTTPPGEIRNSPGSLADLFRKRPPYRERVINLCKAYYQAVNNGIIRPAAPPRASHSTDRAGFDHPRLSSQID